MYGKAGKRVVPKIVAVEEMGKREVQRALPLDSNVKSSVPVMVPPRSAVDYKELLARLEDAYRSGRVTERTYKKLKEEYSEKVKNRKIS